MQVTTISSATCRFTTHRARNKDGTNLRSSQENITHLIMESAKVVGLEQALAICGADACRRKMEALRKALKRRTDFLSLSSRRKGAASLHQFEAGSEDAKLEAEDCGQEAGATSKSRFAALMKRELLPAVREDSQ